MSLILLEVSPKATLDLIMEFHRNEITLKWSGVISVAELPKTTIKHVLRGEGTDRLAGDIIDAVNEIAQEIAKEGIKSAKGGDRKTMSARNLRLVVAGTGIGGIL